MYLVQVSKSVHDRKAPLERLHGKRPTQEFGPFGEKVLAKQNTTDPTNRMIPRCKYGIWLGMRSNGADCCIGNADAVFRTHEIRRLEPRSWWDWSCLENDRREVDSG